MSGGGDKGGYDPAKLGNTLGKKLESYVNAKPPVFKQNLYPGLSDTTRGGLQSLLGTANNPAFSQGISGALGSYANRAAGNELGMDAPGYRSMRDTLMSDITGQVNGAFNSSGLFGADSNQTALARGLTEGVGALDYGNYQDSLSRQAEATQMLPMLFEAGQAPAQTQLGVGAALDADAQAQRQGDFDLFDRTQNADFRRFQELLLAFNGTQANAGMQEQPNMFQQLLGGGLGLLGLL